MTRVGTRDNEQQLLEFALRHTAVTVAERCRELRCGMEKSIGTAERAWANRSLRARRDRERNMMTITIELPLDTGELLEKALDKARDDEVLEIPNLAASRGLFRRPLRGQFVRGTGTVAGSPAATIDVS